MVLYICIKYFLLTFRKQSHFILYNLWAATSFTVDEFTLVHFLRHVPLGKRTVVHGQTVQSAVQVALFDFNFRETFAESYTLCEIVKKKKHKIRTSEEKKEEDL